jgi:Leucine-rich repeat (LRR) protein
MASNASDRANGRPSGNWKPNRGGSGRGGRVQGKASARAPGGLRARYGAPFAQRSAAPNNDNKRSLEVIFNQALATGKLSLASRGLERAPLREFLEVASSGIEGGMNFWEVVDLASLDLSHNHITELPMDELQALRSLEVLNLQSNPLSVNGVPFEALAMMENLKSLNLACIGYDGQPFPENVAACVQLVELTLKDNGITSLPETMAYLNALKILSCANNLLTTLPRNLPLRLLRIDLTNNNIASLPECFGALQQLETLELSKNKLENVRCLEKLGSLRSVNLRQNLLTQVPVLPGNGVLDSVLLGSNRIQQVPAAHVLPCRETLTLLDLSGNKVRQLPDDLGGFYRLKTLDLTNNDLNAIPFGLGWIVSLTRMPVDGNAIRSIRRSLLTQGVEALKKYLRSRGGKHEMLPDQYTQVDDNTVVQPRPTGQLGRSKNIASFERMFD